MTTPDEERAHWNAVAQSDDTTLKNAIWGEPHIENAWKTRLEACLAEIRPTLPERGVVLDLGCGIGRLLIPLAMEQPDVTFAGADISRVMLDRMLLAAQAANVPNVRAVLVDGRRLSSWREAPELAGAYSMLLFQHIPPTAFKSYLSDIERLLVPGGAFRFQLVLGGESAPFSEHLLIEFVENVCDAVGFPIEDINIGRIYPEWVWVTARKR